MMNDIRSVSGTLSTVVPSLAASFARSASKSHGGNDAPGRPLIGGRPLSTAAWSGGKPPGGTPRRPSKYSTTDDGKLSLDASRST